VSTVRDLLVALLRDAGVSRVVGEPLGDLQHVACDDPDLACLLADVDGRVNGGFGAALLRGPILHLSSRIGGTATLAPVTTVDELVATLASLDPRGPLATVAVHLDLDLDAEVPEPLAPPERERDVVLVLDPALAELRLALVVGPGVVRAGATSDLLSLATSMNVAVVNTWGAKGVFRWDSPFHAGTAGLQARDWELAGVHDADVVVASGLDPDEVDVHGLGHHVVQEVSPAQLGTLAARWERKAEEPVRPPLYETIASVVRPLYEDEGEPLSPARAALHLSGASPEHGVTIADADLAGFWVARTFPTGIPGSVVVAPQPMEGAAVAGALMARLAGRPALAVTAHVGGVTEQLLEVADRAGQPVAVQVWEPDGQTMSPADHAALCGQQFQGAVTGLTGVAVRLDPSPLVEVAGELDVRFTGGA
jgi:hypothetical protein